MSHEKHAPTLPQVTDEAANTPNWVPALGFGLFALFALLFAVRHAMHDAAPTNGAADAPAAAEQPTNPPAAADAPRQAVGVAPNAPAH
ncbi:MAG TPA: hypothetical protein VF331_19015 [Polyangiales bacterium]